VGFEELPALIRAALKDTSSNLVSFEERCRLIDMIGESRRANNGKKRWGIKIMREVKNCKRYLKVWPKAQFIHIIRDGRDVAASQMAEHGSWGYQDIEKAARGWMELAQKTRDNAEQGKLLEIRYEDLVLDSEETLRRITGFLGVPYVPVMVNHQDADHTLFKNPYNHASIKQVIHPINASSIGRYKRDLSEGQVATFERIAGAELLALGYSS
ncbi:MAG: sulfotransferase family protein, partial [Nitrososphaera sp.]